MHIPPKGDVKGTRGTAKNNLLANRGSIGMFVTRFRNMLQPGRVDLFSWIKITTFAFSKLLQASCAIVVHDERYNYFINEANFSHGQFAPNNYLGTEDLGWDRFDALFARELEENKMAMSRSVACSMPAKGICIPNLNADAIVVFDREGRMVERKLQLERVNELIFDRNFQERGSIMLVPIIAKKAEEAKRALVYLYSPEVDHFKLPIAGYAAHLLAGAAAPALKSLLGEA